jgi:hypothetical protein
MGIRGNAGFINIDKRFGNTEEDVKGSIQREQHFLERKNGRYKVLGDLSPANNVTAWFDASSQYITLNGSNVSTWSDRSGNGIDLVQNTPSAQPLYNSSNVSINNLPSVDCDDDNSMETNDDNLLDVSGTGGFTAYLVGKLDAQNSAFAFLIGRTNGTSWTLGWGVYFYSGAIRWFVNDWNTASQRCETSIPGTTSANIYKMRYDNSTITVEIIGPNADSDTQSYSSTVQEPTSEGLIINAGGSTAFDCDFDYAEYLFYNRPLTVQEQEKTENYLKEKYNIV